MSLYYLDTNTCIRYLRGSSENVRTRLLQTDARSVRIPSIVAAELYLGAYKGAAKTGMELLDEYLNKIDRFLSPFEVVMFGKQQAKEYAQIRSFLEDAGNVIGPNDLIVAATVRADRSGVLVTNNIREFSRIKGLAVDDWT